MIAIGFLLVLFGIIGIIISYNSSSIPDWVESIFAAMFAVGCVMIVIGLVVLMWRYLP